MLGSFMKNSKSKKVGNGKTLVDYFKSSKEELKRKKKEEIKQKIDIIFEEEESKFI
jgi:hypothetical protein